MGYKLRILSLGAGVQSSTLLLMAERGQIEPFHCAIFADTGWESGETYKHLWWLQQLVNTPIITVSNGNIFEWEKNSQLRDGKLFSVMPCHTRTGMMRRQCTTHYKIKPILKEVRNLLGLKPYQKAPSDAVDLVIGISFDEAQRMRGRLTRTVDRSYPLVDMGITRYQCKQWLMKHYGLIVPKSACVGCPYHTNVEWRQVKEVPTEWAQAMELDSHVRGSGLFLHSKRIPLEEVDLSTPEERGQGVFDFIKDEKLNLFVNRLSIANDTP